MTIPPALRERPDGAAATAPPRTRPTPPGGADREQEPYDRRGPPWLASGSGRGRRRARRQALPRRVPARRPRVASATAARSRRSGEATIRKRWIAGELAALRVPDLPCSTPSRPRCRRSPRRPSAGGRRGSTSTSRRGTCTAPRFGAIFKVAPELRAPARRRDRPSTTSTALVAALAAAVQARDDPQDARPRSRRCSTTTASTRTRSATSASSCRRNARRTSRRRSPSTSSGSPRRSPREYVLPLLVIDECGPRVSELETAEVGDLDEHRRAIRVRWTFEKNERYRHLDLPDDLFAALLATLPPREDRDLEAPLFPGLTDARAADGDHPGLQGDRDAALLPARPTPPARLAALQAHRLARRGRRAARRLEAGRRRPLRLRADRLPRGRPTIALARAKAAGRAR